ncbi:MAG: hypothetical protein JWN18_417 [Parcubacteria group bacterium]|nr:hypothetical protein [Parcubacteria group bacterium]
MQTPEEVSVVSHVPLVLVLSLPDGCTSGRWEAAESFAASITRARQLYPGRQFQFIPFSYKTDGDGKDPALETMLAIAQ